MRADTDFHRRFLGTEHWVVCRLGKHPTTDLPPAFFLWSESVLLGFPGYLAHSAPQVILESLCNDGPAPLCLKLGRCVKVFFFFFETRSHRTQTSFKLDLPRMPLNLFLLPPSPKCCDWYHNQYSEVLELGAHM